MLRSPARHAILAVYVAVMLAVLLVPVPRRPDYLPSDFDKVVHAGLFLGLGLVAAWAATGGRGRRSLTGLVWITALGALTELLQGMLPYRSGDPLDMAADLAGGLIGALLGCLPRNE